MIERDDAAAAASRILWERSSRAMHGRLTSRCA
jgi:hypothetical protein